MVHQEVCPLCSSEKIALLFRGTDHFISKEVFPVFRCGSCNFIFTQDYPDENEIGHYYESEEYISHSDTTKGFSNKLYRIARGIMLQSKKSLVLKSTGLNKGSILDIGSGTGYFASLMKESGWKVKGIEINEKAREFSASRFNLDVSSPSDLSSLASESLDCVTLWHVLEHFHDPYKYISEINRVLKPGSVCIIALPNSSSYDSKYYKAYWAAWDVPRHLWHFNPSTFKMFSEKAGFKDEKIRILPLDVFYISQLSEKYKGSSFPFIQGILKATVFAILTLFNKKRASSIIYTLRKPEN
jgi:2-polyprenyl-3-methyl-5-hydroxy-6-metoxy-1,4-benzoquinol methylase